MPGPSREAVDVLPGAALSAFAGQASFGSGCDCDWELCDQLYPLHVDSSVLARLDATLVYMYNLNIDPMLDLAVR